jgi:hypothetical protein
MDNTRRRMRATAACLITLTWCLAAEPSAQSQSPGTIAPTSPEPRRTAAAQTLPGRPPGQIAGRVVRPDGLPQPDADVVLASRTQRGTLVQLPWRARTAFDGRYEIQRVPPGRYLVLVRPIGADVAAAGRPDATLFPGVPTSEPGTAVEVLPGLSAEGIDIWLVPSPRRFAVSGRVYGPDGSAFDTLVIEMGRPETKATDLSTITDPGGLFTLDPVPPGVLVLRARATIGKRVLTGLASTTVAVQAVEDVRIVVRDLVEVSGHVRAETGPMPPTGLAISMVPAVLGPTPLYPADDAQIHADGSFRLRVEPGRGTVAVRGLPSTWDVLRVTPGDRRALPTLVIPSGAGLSGVEVVVGPRASPSSGLTSNTVGATVRTTGATEGR